MRVLTALLLLPLLAVQVHTQAAAAPLLATSATAAAPATQGRTHAASKHARRHYMSWKQRFATANTTHDGHLTLAQAKDGYYAVARHFRQIDTGQKGYVTLADIAAWHKAQREKRREHRDPEGKTAHRHRGAKGGMAAANTAPDAKSAPAVSPGQASVSSPASPTARNGR